MPPRRQEKAQIVNWLHQPQTMPRFMAVRAEQYRWILICALLNRLKEGGNIFAAAEIAYLVRRIYTQ